MQGTQSFTPNSEFLWGVATSGYQSEGGYNQPGQPQNNWAQAEHHGSVMVTGAASDFWHRYAEDFQTCQDMGLNAFRIGLEWARIQPTTLARRGLPPEFDKDALDAYSDRLASCMQHGLEPVITLHHFTHPAWLGADAWLSIDTVQHFVEYVRVTVAHINHRLIHHYHLNPIRWFITLNEPNMLVTSSYLSRQFPAKEMGSFGLMQQAYCHLLLAHVHAYNCIHDLYEQAGWERPQVSLNTYCSDLYWSEKVLWDVLSVAERDIKPASVKAYVHSKARQLEAALKAARFPFRRDLPYQLGRLAHTVSNFVGYRLFEMEEFRPLLQALYSSPRTRVFDFVGLDYYDPFVAHVFRLPRFTDFEFKSKDIRTWLMTGITSKWWDWRSLPEGLHFFCQYYSQDLGDRPVLIAENGMALRRKPDNSIATHRLDQLRRSEFLELHVEQVQRLRQDGVPLLGYLHWSLTDNYEWGSYTPRFGLFSIDYAHGTERLAETYGGDRPSETYARLVKEARGQDANVAIAPSPAHSSDIPDTSQQDINLA
ncbi:glycoside hydrolase family 1 protein [Leptolyngbya sp. AN02str]|uniref:glycoside hydrolase family 1 protein n=1 Tax=Leptolyngbya sp. AN02str TaxID=3423363 RepID=UPI003D3203A7